MNTYEESGSDARLKKLERVKGLVEQNLGELSGTDFSKLRMVLDFIDDDVVREHELAYRRVNKFVLERNSDSNLNMRRSEIEVLATMLDVARHGTNKTKILYKANLSYTLLKNYLSFLLDRGLMETNGLEKRPVYKTTVKGLVFLSLWVKMIPLLE